MCVYVFVNKYKSNTLSYPCLISYPCLSKPEIGKHLQ